MTNTNTNTNTNTKSTSFNLDPELWKECKKMAIDEGITLTEFVKRACKERIAKTNKS